MRETLQRARPVLGGICLWLVSLEVALQILIRLPGALPARFEIYLRAGASTETRLRVALDPRRSPDPTETALLRAGWTDPEALGALSPARAEIAIYGMSYTRELARVLRDELPGESIRSVSGPASPPSQAFDAFVRDPAQASLEVAVLGVSSIERTRAMTTDTLGAAVLTPATFPRYEVVEDELVEHLPAVRSFPELEAALDDPERWREHVARLRAHDRYYSALFYESNPIEKLVLGRLLLAGAQSQRTIAIRRRIHDRRGFRTDTALGREAVETTAALLIEFDRLARDRGQIPIVLLISRPGYADHLERVLAPTLSSRNISFLSTHRVCPSSDRRCLAPDLYHFSAETNRALARALIAIVDAAER